MKLLTAALFSLGLTACASTGVEQYRAEQPALDLKTYLNGTLDAWGMFQGRSGEVKKRFHVVIDAQWQGDTGVLDENFKWSDGTWRGTADDVVGEALGEVAGNALRWRYVLALPVDGRTWHVDFDDWMFLMDDKVMLNRSFMSKWGIRLGEVTLTFVKR